MAGIENRNRGNMPANSIKFPVRYNFENMDNKCGCGMYEESCGEWVKFEDIKGLLNSLHNKQSAPFCLTCGKPYPIKCHSCQATDIVRITV